MKVRIPERQRILNPKARPTIRAMLQRCAAQTLIEVFGFGGSGTRIEHDLMFLAYLVALHMLEHFGDKRLERFQQELCRRIRYYNYVFDGTPDVVLDVMDDRLARYGKRPYTEGT